MTHKSKADRRSWSLKYYHAHRQECIAKTKDWAIANYERKAASSKAWAAANPEKIRAASIRYRLAHRDEINRKKREERKKPPTFRRTPSEVAARLLERAKILASPDKYGIVKLPR